MYKAISLGGITIDPNISYPSMLVINDYWEDKPENARIIGIIPYTEFSASYVNQLLITPIISSIGWEVRPHNFSSNSITTRINVLILYVVEI